MTVETPGRSGVEELDIQSLRLIRAIADEGSLTAAATRLRLSQPAVSQQLKKIETRLGLLIVERVGRRVRLTQVGEILARYAVTISTALSAAAGEISEVSGMRSGRVRIAAFPTASSTIVPKLLSRMAAQHPGVTISYMEAEPIESIEALSNGSIDLAITFSYAEDRVDPHLERPSGLTASPLWSDEMLLVLPSGHDAAAGESVRLSSLRNERWIAGCPICRGHLVAVCDSEGFAPNIAFETDNFVAVTNMVAEGLGVALVPNLALVASPPPPGTVVRPVGPRAERKINLVRATGADKVPSSAAIAGVLAGLDPGVWSLKPVL